MNLNINPVVNNPSYTAGNNCASRISQLIFLMIFSLIFFCLGIFGMTEFYSTTDSYKSINKTGIVKHLKGIEIGLGGILLAFPIIFFGVAIAFLVFTCGKKEYQVLPIKLYIKLNILKILCIVLSILFAALSILYAALITKALNDIEVEGVANMMVGYLIIIYYIICICIFIDERRTFVLVGTSESPGPYAKYDLNFQPIIRQNPENINNQGIGNDQMREVQIHYSNYSNAYMQNMPKNQNMQNVYIKQNIMAGNSGDRMIDGNINEKNKNLNNKK